MLKLSEISLATDYSGAVKLYYKKYTFHDGMFYNVLLKIKGSGKSKKVLKPRLMKSNT